jgi:DNA-binding winged helix-turn-helix (wHTH) protein
MGASRSPRLPLLAIAHPPPFVGVFVGRDTGRQGLPGGTPGGRGIRQRRAAPAAGFGLGRPLDIAGQSDSGETRAWRRSSPTTFSCSKAFASIGAGCSGAMSAGCSSQSRSARACDVLRALITAQGDLIAKDEIMVAVWPGTVVEDNNLTVQISALRRILDRGRSEGSCIQTVAGRGYRFVPAVVPLAAEADSGTVAVSGRAPPPPRLSIVVLPFSNLSSDPDQEYFADGITDDLTIDLSRISGSLVIARSTAFTYKGKAVDGGLSRRRNRSPHRGAPRPVRARALRRVRGRLRNLPFYERSSSIFRGLARRRLSIVI